MKKFVKIVSIILVLSFFTGINAYAKDAWETTPISLEGKDSWETDEIPVDDVIDTKDERISISKCKISGVENKTYSGKKKYLSLVVKYGKKTLVKNTDYKLDYENNIKVGTASVKIKGIGKYKSSVKKTFKIVPKSTTVSKLSKPKTKQVKVTWKKQKTQTTGYQIKYATNSKFTKNAKTVTVKGNTKTSKTIKSLKKKQKYYFKVRTYKTVNGKNYYSSWSKAKSIITK